MDFRRCCSVVAVILAAHLAPASDIVVNEVSRGASGGDLELNDDFIEVVLLKDLTATQLETFYVGDVYLSSTSTKGSAYKFTSMSSIASTFRKGTIIAIGGATAFAQDTSYNPGAGDWAVHLRANGSYAVRQGTRVGDVGSSDVIWVDTVATGSTISTAGFAVRYGTFTSFSPTVALDALAPNGGKSIVLNSPNEAGITSTANWLNNAIPTPGAANNATNASFLAIYQPVSMSAFSAE